MHSQIRHLPQGRQTQNNSTDFRGVALAYSAVPGEQKCDQALVDGNRPIKRGRSYSTWIILINALTSVEGEWWTLYAAFSPLMSQGFAGTPGQTILGHLIQFCRAGSSLISYNIVTFSISLNLVLKANSPWLIFGSPTISRADTDLKCANNLYFRQNNLKRKPSQWKNKAQGNWQSGRKEPLILILQQIACKWCLREAIGLHKFPCWAFYRIWALTLCHKSRGKTLKWTEVCLCSHWCPVGFIVRLPWKETAFLLCMFYDTWHISTVEPDCQVFRHTFSPEK